MSKLKIAIIISTTRAARFGHKPAQWIQDFAAGRDDMETEIIDLRDFPMPFFDEVASNAWAPSQDAVAQRWQKKVAGFDAMLFVRHLAGEDVEWNAKQPHIFWTSPCGRNASTPVG